VNEKAGGASSSTVSVQDVELTLQEFSEINGIQQVLKQPNL
jgi:hypothetical protein